MGRTAKQWRKAMVALRDGLVPGVCDCDGCRGNGACVSSLDELVSQICRAVLGRRSEADQQVLEALERARKAESWAAAHRQALAKLLSVRDYKPAANSEAGDEIDLSAGPGEDWSREVAKCVWQIQQGEYSATVKRLGEAYLCAVYRGERLLDSAEYVAGNVQDALWWCRQMVKRHAARGAAGFGWTHPGEGLWLLFTDDWSASVLQADDGEQWFEACVKPVSAQDDGALWAKSVHGDAESARQWCEEMMVRVRALGSGGVGSDVVG